MLPRLSLYNILSESQGKVELEEWPLFLTISDAKNVAKQLFFKIHSRGRDSGILGDGGLLVILLARGGPSSRASQEARGKRCKNG
jgi:hypothetical protein